MKILILLLVIQACGKVGMKPIESKSSQKTTSALSVDFKRYDENIDIMVAFLWPLEIKTESQRKDVREIISVSRKLNGSKDIYYAKKIELQTKFKENHCQCALYDLCEADEVPGPVDVCTELEAEGYTNDARLIPVLEMVEKVKTLVKHCGGEWLDTQSDLADAGISRFDFTTLRLFFSALGSVDGVGIPYEIDDVQMTEQGSYTELKFQIPHPQGGEYDFELGMRGGKVSLTIQGEIILSRGNLKRRGIIYWEHPSRS